MIPSPAVRAEAGERALALLAEIRALAPSPAALLGGPGPLQAVRHYPEGDVYDFSSHSQFYFHTHRLDEFGHFHLFLRPKGMPPGLVAAVPTGEADAPCHLGAVAVGAGGDATALFTTNRWVTGEAWYPAAAVAAMQPCFRVGGQDGVAGPRGLVGRWLTALVTLFADDFAALVEERDAAVAAFAASHHGVALDDPRLEVTSHRSVDVAARLSELTANR
ncbi:MAG: hypothetical protein HY985_08310 [Magnetospirillum sp.]|nr:hypothetical protein [Magnetospirillum sp.]